LEAVRGDNRPEQAVSAKTHKSPTHVPADDERIGEGNNE
jgi:hypothetical protein